MATNTRRRYDTTMAFAKIDHWIGKTLFVPPILKLCQLTRQSQFAISRLFWFVAALDGLYRAETLFGSLLWGGMSVVMMLSAARRADYPTNSFMLADSKGAPASPNSITCFILTLRLGRVECVGY